MEDVQWTRNLCPISSTLRGHSSYPYPVDGETEAETVGRNHPRSHNPEKLEIQGQDGLGPKLVLFLVLHGSSIQKRTACKFLEEIFQKA